MLRNNTPVLLIAFNRPDTTKIVLERIRELQPEKLFIAIDGPRTNKMGEQAKVQEVVGIVGAIDWPCKVFYKKEKENLGCRDAVISAIDWVFEKEEYVIVIEDDVIPTLGFFHFAAKMLDAYKDNTNVGLISANNYSPIDSHKEYYFSSYTHIWGWATWKRVWQEFKIDPLRMEEVLKLGPKQGWMNRKEKYYLRWYFNWWLESWKDGTSKAWGPYFFFHIFSQGLLAIVPSNNIATNIGLVGTHAKGELDQHNWPVDNTFSVCNIRDRVIRDIEYDQYHMKNYLANFGPPTFAKRLSNRFKRFFRIQL